jgi:zinc and cadmium transporter
MSQVWIYSLASVAVVSLVSFVGAFTLAIDTEKLKGWLLYLVSFAAGALLGDVFLHILPEMSENGLGAKEGVYILSGILIFFALERVVWWHHSHSDHKEEIHTMVYVTQVGDTLHNFIDGVIIAGSYFISIPVGIATTLAVIFHEIPQELGNFAVLLHGGWKVKKALLYNFFSALAAVLGALITLVFLKGFGSSPTWLTALAASSFIYIAMSDLIPEIHKEQNNKKSAFLLVWFTLGIVAMGLLLLLE